MTEFRVMWEIDIDADTPEEAARKALAIQRDPTSSAVVFNVVSSLDSLTTVNPENIPWQEIDLIADEAPAQPAPDAHGEATTLEERVSTLEREVEELRKRCR